jgi:hypothetical protein
MAYDFAIMTVSLELVLRRLILALLTFGLIATTGELFALGHYKEAWQLVPIACLVGSLLVIAWHVFFGGAASLRVLRFIMFVTLLVGLTGVVLHFRESRAFQLDANPDLSGLPLILKVLRAKSPPALAPGAMVQMGLLGLIYVFRHPMLKK